MILAALVAAFVVLGAAPAIGHNRSSPAERYFAHRCGDQNHTAVLSCIHRAALHWQVDYRYMRGIAWRESRYDPRAKNPSSTASGVMQFLTSTWYGSWNPYRGQSIWSAKSNTLAAAYAMRLGYYSWWACC
jgi:soluble lytic murein transglycosylase-like protein